MNLDVRSVVNLYQAENWNTVMIVTARSFTIIGESPCGYMMK